jgi:O-antigen/teichoic acid export membrane protein
MKPAKNNFSSLTSYLSILTTHFSPLTSYLSRFLSHPGVRRYGINTAWLFTEQVLRLIAGFFVGVWVARYLGPEKFGLFSYALAFVSIFQGIAKLGLDGIVVRDLVQEPEKRDVYLGTSFWLKLLGGIITFLIITIILVIQSLLTSHLSPLTSHFSPLTSYLSPFTSHFFTETNIYILIIAFGIIFQSFEVIDFYYQATVQAKYISIRRIIQLILSSIIKIFLVLTGADLIWFVLVSLFDIISLSIMGWLIYRSQGLPNFVRYFDIEIGKKLLKDSWPLLLSSIAISIYMRIDQVMIKNMLGDREVGLYSAAMRLVEVWYFIPMIITQSVFPAIVNAKKISEEVYYKRLQQLFSLLIWIAIFIAIPMSVFSHQIIYLLYGDKYLSATYVLKIYVWACIFSFFGTARGSWLVIENLQNVGLYYVIFGSLSNVILNLIMIKKDGIVGAAEATVMSSIFIALLFPLLNKRVRPSVKMFFKSFFLLGG